MIQPYGNRVAVEPVKDNEVTTKSGLYVPANDKTLITGKVIAVGDIYYPISHVLPKINVGDIVFYRPSFSTETAYKDKVYVLIDADNIIAIWRENE